MTAAVAHAVMVLATRSLGEGRREWGLAMQAEFEAALDDGKPLAFAAGCLVAAWREMPARAEGRFTLVSHALALGMLIPMAILQITAAAGLPNLLQGPAGLYGMLAAPDAQNPFSVTAGLSAAPIVLMLWLLLGISQVGIAWALLERDWSHVLRIGALAAAASVTLAMFSGLLVLDGAGVALHGAALAIELAALYGCARWHARLFPHGSPRDIA
jgi:hypothetical protein